MKVFIDTNPRWSGGYLAHLKGILTAGCIPDDMQITVYGTQRLFDAIGPVDKNVEIIVDNYLPMNPILMYLWRLRNVPKLLSAYAPDVHFAVSGHMGKTSSNHIKHVAMSRNLQPHLATERQSLPLYSFGRFRLEVLHRTLKSSFGRADGVIFLTEYVREVIQREGVNLKRSAVIPHGLSESFRHPPVKRHLPEKPIVLYVSPFNVYKFQWQVARGLDIVRKETGINLQLHLVGGKSPDGWKMFEKVLSELNNPKWIEVTEHIPYSEIHKVYQSADIFIFASTVETIGNILIEAMASGLPIAYSNRRPMTDILGDDGIVFEPEEANSIASAVMQLLQDDDLRFNCAEGAYKRALAYRWERTARETFDFLREVHRG